jgi:hypothetical protein
MYLYKQTIIKKNTAGKITALLTLPCGAILFITANNLPSYAAIVQCVGVLLIGASIFIASYYLLRSYTFSVEMAKAEEDESFAEQYDLIITENKGNRHFKVCHLSVSDISAVRVVEPDNKKQIQSERKRMKRYTYNTEYAPSRQIEIVATVSDEELSILITYEEDLFRVLNSFLKEEKGRA